MSKTLKLEIVMSIYSFLDALKHTDVVDEISRKVNDVLREKDKQASASSIIKASKNSLSLLLHRKKQTIPPVLPIYLPMNLVQCVSDTVVPTVSSDEDMPQPSEEEHDNSSDSNSEKNTLSPISHSPLISFSVCNGLVKIDVTFEYLQDYLKHSLSVNNKPMNLDKMVTDICTYVFLDLRYSVHVRSLKNEICRQISYIVQSARVRASGRSAIGILRTTKSFSLTSKSIICLNYKQLDIEFSEYRNSDDLSPILLIRKNDEETDIFQFYPLPNTVEITVNDTLVKKCLSSFDLTRTIDVYELSCLVTKCALVHNIQVDVLLFEEEIKTKILFDYPGQRVQDNSGRNTLEVTETWKQYSGRKISGFFPVHSDHFPVLSRQKLVGNHRKKSGIFRPEYCFHDPVTSGAFLQDPAFFSVSFLQVP